MKKFAAICSSGGSVLRKALEKDQDNFSIDLIITDRQCGAVQVAKDFNIPHIQIRANDNVVFSEKTLETLQNHQIDYVFLFFTRLLTGKIIDVYSDRIINFHLSILPSHRGLNGFSRSMQSSDELFGSTAHIVGHGMDDGRILSRYKEKKSLYNGNIHHMRHIIFAQQVAALLSIYDDLSGNQKRTEDIARIYDEITSEYTQ